MEEKQVKSNGNGKVEVPKEVLDIVAGLKDLRELEGIEYPLTRLEILARIIDDRLAAYRWKCPEAPPAGRYL